MCIEKHQATRNSTPESNPSPIPFLYKHSMPLASKITFPSVVEGFIALPFISDDAVTERGFTPCRFMINVNCSDEFKVIGAIDNRMVRLPNPVLAKNFVATFRPKSRMEFETNHTNHG